MPFQLVLLPAHQELTSFVRFPTVGSPETRAPERNSRHLPRFPTTSPSKWAVPLPPPGIPPQTAAPPLRPPPRIAPPPPRRRRDDVPPGHRRVGGARGPHLGRGRGGILPRLPVLEVLGHGRSIHRRQGEGATSQPLVWKPRCVRCSLRVCRIAWRWIGLGWLD